MRIPEVLLNCVGFLCVKVSSGGSEYFKYGGTAFFVSVQSETSEKMCHLYLVTARHCVEQAKRQGNLYLRLNTKSGDARIFLVTAEWQYPENEASDVAVLAWAPSTDLFEFNWIPDSIFATPEIIRTESIGIGDNVAITGLFSFRHGTQRNLPVLRSGIIASMPLEPLEDENTGLKYDAYFIEARSIGGLSGSPVYVVLEPDRHGVTTLSSRKIFLLGLIRGHWDYKKRKPPIDFSEEELENVNMGMAIVTPVQDMITCLQNPVLLKQRKRKDLEFKKEQEK